MSRMSDEAVSEAVDALIAEFGLPIEPAKAPQNKAVADNFDLKKPSWMTAREEPSEVIPIGRPRRKK